MTDIKTLKTNLKDMVLNLHEWIHICIQFEMHLIRSSSHGFLKKVTNVCMFVYLFVDIT